MAALTGTRDTRARGAFDAGRMDEFGVANGVQCFQGSICVLNSSGEVQPGTAALGLTALGVAQLPNPLSTAANEFAVETRVGTYQFDSGTAGDTITKADRGKVCWIIDDQTVGLTDGGGTRSAAGRIYDVDPLGVWVDFVYPLAVGA